MCGDATNAEDVALLIDRKKANLIVTNPPYGVSFKSSEGLTIQNDSMSRFFLDGRRVASTPGILTAARLPSGTMTSRSAIRATLPPNHWTCSAILSAIPPRRTPLSLTPLAAVAPR